MHTPLVSAQRPWPHALVVDCDWTNSMTARGPNQSHGSTVSRSAKAAQHDATALYMHKQHDEDDLMRVSTT